MEKNYTANEIIVALVIGVLIGALVMQVSLAPTIYKQKTEVARLNKEVAFGNRQALVTSKFLTEFLRKIQENNSKGLPLSQDLPKVPRVEK